MSRDDYVDRQAERRRFYTQGEGGPLVQDVGSRFYNDVGDGMPITRLEDPSLLPILDEPSSAVSGFAALASHLYTLVWKYADLSPERRAAYDISVEELSGDRNPGVQGGVADMQFAAGVIPAIAVHISHQMVIEGLVTVEQRDNWQLHDWASMLDSSWFRAVIHDMALTGNAVYRQFGSVPSDYGRGEFHKQSRYNLKLDDSIPLFTLKPAERKGELPSAEVSPELHAALRNAMRERIGFGCPVARKAGPLPLDLLTFDDQGHASSPNPHIAHLIDTDNMHIERVSPQRNIARYTLRHSAIDRAIDGVAANLRRYEQEYGTPHYNMVSHSLEHLPRQVRKPKGLLMRILALG